MPTMTSASFALGSSFSHRRHWPWNGIAYCELPSEPSIVVISVIESLRASLKKRHACACSIMFVSHSKSIQTGGKITSTTTAAAVFNNWVDVRCCLKCYRGYLWVCSDEWSSMMLSSKRVMCVAFIPDILSYGKMLFYDKSYTRSVNN